jgi:SAM-dependent methyltransferase
MPDTLIDVEQFHATAEPLAIQGRRSFNFLSVFDWTLRKGWDLLVEAYLAEFEASDDVALILKPTSTSAASLQQVASELEAHVIALGRDPRDIPTLILEWAEVPVELMPSLYRAADCFVLPSRAEGPGRALLEAQACGLPAIAPAWAAAGKLLPPASPLHIAPSDVGETDASPECSEPEVGDLRLKLRAAFADPVATRALGADAARFVRERFPTAAARGCATSAAPPARADRTRVQVGATLETDNPYTFMQRGYYENTADEMNEVNHMTHNANRDYWDILLGDTLTGFRDKIGLDFGCGCGRNVMNLWNRFARMDGVDLSYANLVHARLNILACGTPQDAFRLYACNGIDLREVTSDEYDFVVSTIVLQHIAVHDIRLSYLREFFRIMRPGGLLSFQMGFGEGHGRAGYYENHYSAPGTNSQHDTTVTDPGQVQGDLEAIGFDTVSHVIRPSYDDGHPLWIYVKARKPHDVAPQPGSRG